MTPERANAIYDVLMLHCHANRLLRDEFVHYHIDTELREGHMEWRFAGNLGWGGKYRANQNRVTCYPEDSTPEREEIIECVNQLLEVV